MNRRLLQTIGPVISVCLFVLAILLIHHELRGYRYRDIVYQMQQIGYRDIATAVVLTILNYLVLTANDALALVYARHPLPYRQLAFASFIGYAFSNSATVVGGSAARYRIYTALGVSAGEIAEVVVYCGLTVWLGFFLVAGTSFVLDPQYVPLPQRLHLPVQSIGILGIVCLAAGRRVHARRRAAAPAHRPARMAVADTVAGPVDRSVRGHVDRLAAGGRGAVCAAAESDAARPTPNSSASSCSARGSG